MWDRSQTPRILMSGSREPGAREREKERLFLAIMPSSSLPESQTQGAETELPVEFF